MQTIRPGRPVGLIVIALIGTATLASPALAQRDVVFVIDCSGSMDKPGFQSTTTKFDELKSAAAQFLQSWDWLSLADDRVGVIYFGSDVRDYSAGGSVLVPVSANADAIRSDIESQVAGGRTAMGGGLQQAINALSDADRARHVLLFTDGKQNQSPVVEEVGGLSGVLEIVDQPGMNASNVAATTPPTRLDAALGIKISVVGIGVPPGPAGRLNEIAASTGGGGCLLPPNPTDDPWDYLYDFLDNDFETILGDASPQLVASRRGLLTREGAAETFLVNRSASKIIFRLRWKEADAVDFRVEKDGVDLTEAAEAAAGRGYRSLFFDLTKLELAREGKWIMRIAPHDGQTRYQATALVDEKQLHWKVAVGRDRNLVHKPLKLTARLSAAGRPVVDARSVVALVSRPRHNLSQLLLQQPLTNEEDRPLSSAEKLAIVAKDGQFRERLIPAQQWLTLEHTGAGLYEAELPAGMTQVPGVYGVKFEAWGDHRAVGTYHRTRIASAVVEVGLPELAASDVNLQPGEVKERQQQYKLTVDLNDRWGNPLGLDQARRIRLRPELGQLLGRPRDLGNGKYEFSFEVPVDSDPRLRLTFRNATVFNEHVQRIRSGRVRTTDRERFTVSMPSGKLVPQRGASQEALALAARARSDRLHVVVQFVQKPSSDDVGRLKSRGIRLLDEIPNHAYAVSLPPRMIPGLAKDPAVRAVFTISANDKLSRALKTDNLPPHALTERKEVLADVSVFRDVDEKAAVALLRRVGIAIQGGQAPTWQVRAARNRLLRLAKEDIIRLVKEIAPRQR